MQELLALTKRPLKTSEFAKVFFDFEPYPYQKTALDCTDRFVMLNWARQTGKSENASLIGIHDAMWNDDHVVVILAPKLQQARRLFKKVKRHLRASDKKYPQLDLLSNIERETQGIVEFHNGSSIECLTIGDDGGNIRGISANLQIIDEVREVENEECWAAINHMLVATGGRQILISTPKTNTYFHQCYKLGTHTYYHASSFDNPRADMKIIEMDKVRMPNALWRQEYLAEWIEDTSQFYPLRLIDARMKKELMERDAPLNQCTYFLGVRS